MRGNHATLGQIDLSTRQQIQGIGIPDLRQRRIGRSRQQAAPPPCLTQARPDHQHRYLLKQPHQLIGRRRAQHHGFRNSRKRWRNVFRTGGQRNHARTAAQSTLCTQQNCPTVTAITANEQHMAELAFVGCRCPGHQTRQVSDTQAPSRERSTVQQLRISLQIVEHQLTRHIRGITGEQPHLQANERDRQVGMHCITKDAARIRAQP
ncbi:hypothetical protein D9M72_538810 [compost metagenome]